MDRNFYTRDPAIVARDRNGLLVRQDMANVTSDPGYQACREAEKKQAMEMRKRGVVSAEKQAAAAVNVPKPVRATGVM